MKFTKSSINPKEIKELEEVLSFKEVRKPLLELNNIKVKASIFSDNDLINVTLDIKGICKVEDAYTLKPIDYKLEFTDSIDISEDINNIDTYYIPGNFVDLNPIILDLIIGELPIRISKEKSIKIEGDGYRVISEEDLHKEKEEGYNPSFDKLKDLDL